MTRRRDPVGLAVVGAGKIGRHRARLAAQHAAVEFIAIADLEEDRARRLAAEVGADVWTTFADDAVSHPDVSAVVVSTPEGAHTEPAQTGAAIRLEER